MLIVILTICMASFFMRHHQQCNECLTATNAMCDASKAFGNWRLRNQGVYIGLSEEGRMLLGCYLEAYDWFLRTHKFIDGTEHREWLVSMFYDFPPKDPDGLPGEDKRGIQQDAFSFYPRWNSRDPYRGFFYLYPLFNGQWIC